MCVSFVMEVHPRISWPVVLSMFVKVLCTWLIACKLTVILLLFMVGFQCHLLVDQFHKKLLLFFVQNLPPPFSVGKVLYS